jgi:UDP-N-acetylglucosamine:LPS N-acetylglucosamine transferase
MNQPSVLIITGPQGHLSIAQSIEQTLQNDFSTKIVAIEEPFIALYTPIYRLFPWAFKIPFMLSQFPWLLSVGKFFNYHRYYRQLLHLINQEKPAVVISTYFMFHPALSKICQEKKIAFFTPFTDPWSIHPLLIDPFATNLVFDQQALQIAQKHQPQANYQITGWFVRSAYEQSYDQNLVRKKLNLKENIFTILIVSGSEGNMTVEKILPSLLTTSNPVQIIVACGNNKIMYKIINQFQKLLGDDSQTSLTALRFEPNLNLYMQAADLIVGKAGPNTLFESIATKTPFFAITHISGQESGNLDIINHYQLGLVEENAKKAAQLLKNIINEPALLAKYINPIEKMATYNRESKSKLRNLVKQSLPN